MLTQPTSAHGWPEEIVLPDGIVVASGYGVRVSVWRGRLRVEDGSGDRRRSVLLHRATSRLKRLVVLGHTGFVSLEAFRWLADIKAAYLQIDADGRVLAAFGPPGTDRPALRRDQAIASRTDEALLLSHWLVNAKLGAQQATLQRFAHLVPVDRALTAISALRTALGKSGTIDELRASEAWAAAAYWQALAPLEVRFARRDASAVPTHWRTFGRRSSPLANGPRTAANPANALLNLTYAFLEAEATLAARIVGLDPGLGIMHADQAHRDSLAADLMEPVRPLVDAYVFDLLTSRPFAARDWFESRTGVCRVTPPLTHELAETSARWGKLVGRVAEDFAALLGQRGAGPATTPTPITGRRRAEGRPSGARLAKPPAVSRKPRACSWCGGPTNGLRRTCSDDCAQQVLAQTHVQFAAAGSERLRRLAREPNHPARSPEARRRQSATRSRQRAAELAWEREHPEPVDRERFAREIAPGLAQISARAMARATGLSVSYCVGIKRGERVPHPRWWEILAAAHIQP